MATQPQWPPDTNLRDGHSVHAHPPITAHWAGWSVTYDGRLGRMAR